MTRSFSSVGIGVFLLSRMRKLLFVVLVLTWIPVPVVASGFVNVFSEPFGQFNGVDYVRHVGRFEGTTSLGAYRVPFEIIAPADPSRGNGTLLLEPPHSLFGTVGLDITMGAQFLLGRGFSYATVGFGLDGSNILEPTAADLTIAGQPVIPPVGFDPGAVIDEEIIVQYRHGLSSDPMAVNALGSVDRYYAYGISQTAAVLQETLHEPHGQGLFDFTMLHVALWNFPLQLLGAFQHIPGDYAPPSGVGRVMFVGAEGDQVVTDSEMFRRATRSRDYRVYEVAGAAHQPSPLNPLDHSMVMRALLVAGHDWVVRGVRPPSSRLLHQTGSDEADPLYGFLTGISRDADFNARGGVRLPDLSVGRSQFIASDFSVVPLPGLEGLLGATVDLACQPRAEGQSGRPRFPNHRNYVARVNAELRRLVQARFLLPDDARSLLQMAVDSDVGKPGSCP